MRKDNTEGGVRPVGPGTGLKEILSRLIFAIMVGALIMTPMSYLTGCGLPWAAEQESDEDDDHDDDEDDDDRDETEEESTEEESEEEPPEELTIPDMAVSSNVWSVAGKTIVFASDRIISYDPLSGKSKLLWKDMKKMATSLQDYLEYMIKK